MKKKLNYTSPLGTQSEAFKTVTPSSGNQTHFRDINPNQNWRNPFNGNITFAPEGWKKMGAFWNPCPWPLATYPKDWMSFRKGAFFSCFFIFSLNPKILSRQSISEVFQGKQNLACLPVNYCKVCRFPLCGETANSNKETPIIVIIWKKEAPRLD